MTMDDPSQWLDISRRPRPTDADDALQDALLRIHRGLGGLEQPDRFIPWMYRIAQNAAMDRLRDRTRHPVPRGEDAPEAATSPEAEPGAMEEVARYVASLVGELEEPYKSALELTELRGLTQKVAAEAQGISLTAMKSRVQRGREKLRHKLEKCCAIALDGRRRVVGCEPREPTKSGCC